MHVLQLGPYPPPEGGINRNILAIREELVKSGHRCTIIATSRSTRITPEPGVIHPRTAFDLIKLLLKTDCDILHLHIGGTITKRVMALAFLCILAGRGKKILSFHSGGYPTTDEGKAAKRISARGFIFRRFDQVIAVNPPIASVFARYGLDERGRIHIIHPFVLKTPDESVKIPLELKEFAKKHKPCLLTVGLLEPEYDLFMQIEAFGEIIGEFAPAGLLIIGSGSLESDLKTAINSKTYADNIFLAGDVEHKVTLHLINDCDALLRTTLFDGDAISVHEALFLETPVIATDNKMRPAGVHLIPIHDAKALVTAVKAVAVQKPPAKTRVAEDKTNIDAVLALYEDLTELPSSGGVDATLADGVVDQRNLN